MTAAAITPGPAPVASAQHARGALGCPCAGVPSAAWGSAKRTGYTPLLKIHGRPWLQFRQFSSGPHSRKSGKSRARRAFLGARCPAWNCGARQGVRRRASGSGGVRPVRVAGTTDSVRRRDGWRIPCVPASHPGPVLGSHGPTGINSTRRFSATGSAAIVATVSRALLTPTPSI